MNISIHSCRKLRVWARGSKIALVLLYASVLYSETILAKPDNSFKNYRLTNTVNFHSLAQCPSINPSRLNDNDRYKSSCMDIPKHHLFQFYNPYKSIFHKGQLRPFSFHQQLAMLELFDTLGITEHEYNLRIMVNLTQNKNLSELTERQLEQAREWRELEGEIIHEKACQNDTVCKERVSTALFKMGMYDQQIPPRQHYDYTLFLGGSIQQMQLRMMMMLSLFHSSLKKKNLDLGQIVVLTCNRLVFDREANERPSITMFDVHRDPDDKLAKAFIDQQSELLTETTSYQAIYQSLQTMSQSPAYFARFRETSSGYHPTLPVDFLARSSFEMLLYRKHGFTFQLDEQLPELLKAFFQRYPKPEIIETPIQKIGELIKRPTTKQTVKEWLKRRGNKLTCKDPKHCKILAISNAPNTFYQHIAVLQALEESVTTPTDLIYELSTAGSGASMNIPTNTLLDNLSKLLYLSIYHPRELICFVNRRQSDHMHPEPDFRNECTDQQMPTGKIR